MLRDTQLVSDPMAIHTPVKWYAAQAGIAVAVFTYLVLAGSAAALLPPAAALLFGLLPFAFLLLNRTFRFDISVALLHRFFAASMILFILWPRYMSFNFGGPDIGPSRLLYACLLLSWFVALISPSFREEFIRSASQVKIWLLIILVYCFFRIGSVLGSLSIGSSAYQFLNELVTAILIIPIALSIYRSKLLTESLATCIFFAALIVAILTLIERSLGRTLFANLTLPGMKVDSEWLVAAVMEKSRGGSYRAQSTFSHPLLLAEFVVFALPLAFYNCASASRVRRLLGYVGVILICTAGVMTGSRAAIGVIPVSAVLCITYMLIRNLRQTRRLGIPSILSVFTLSVGAISFAMLTATGQLELGLFEGKTAAEASSTNTRLHMFDKGIPQVLAEPFFGHGPGLSPLLAGVRNRIALTIDSFYLSLALDSGLICLGVFVLLALGVALKGLMSGLQASDSNGLLKGMLAISILGILMVKAVLSTTDNAPLLFVCIALIMTQPRKLG